MRDETKPAENATERFPVLYLGDTALRGAASYLAGVLTADGVAFRHVPSDAAPPAELWATDHQLLVLSDYAAERLTADASAQVLARVASGMGLLMIGGWESYRGLEGFWNRSPIAAALPVELEDGDDRVNFDQLAVLALAAGADDHPIVAGLPWASRPPCIGGFNRFRARADARTLLEVWLHAVEREGDAVVVRRTETHPMLVVGDYGAGRVACLATDAAPHWVGPFVDWGTPRLTAQAPGGNEIEVGAHYARFLQALVRWTGQL